jgi:hypothetical protein
LLRALQLMGLLQVQSEPGAGPEMPREAQRGFCRHPTLALEKSPGWTAGKRSPLSMSPHVTRPASRSSRRISVRSRAIRRRRPP